MHDEPSRFRAQAFSFTRDALLLFEIASVLLRFSRSLPALS